MVPTNKLLLSADLSTLALLSNTVSEINLQELKGFYKAPDVQQNYEKSPYFPWTFVRKVLGKLGECLDQSGEERES